MPRVGPQASARALLDELMGSQRDLPESERREIRFDDPEIDKFWLVGLDPFSMFRNTPWATRLPEMYRRAVGRPWSGDPERRERPRGVREVWAEVPEEAKLKYGYEGELLAFLEELIKTNDRAVQRARLAHEAKASEITDADAEKVKAFDFEIDALTKQAEVAGENGEIDVSLNFMAKVDDLQKRKALVFKPNDVRVQKVLVCEVSGNVVQNTPVRIQEHYQGRIYLSWKSVRDKYAELQAKFHGAAPPRPVPGYDYRNDPLLLQSSRKTTTTTPGLAGGVVEKNTTDARDTGDTLLSERKKKDSNIRPDHDDRDEDRRRRKRPSSSGQRDHHERDHHYHHDERDHHPSRRRRQEGDHYYSSHHHHHHQRGRRDDYDRRHRRSYDDDDDAAYDDTYRRRRC